MPISSTARCRRIRGEMRTFIIIPARTTRMVSISIRWAPTAARGMTTSPIGSNDRMKNRAAHSAFTMIELILVMFVIATALAIVAPSLRGWSHGMNVRNSADEFISLARLARSQAIADATTYRINIDVNAGQYWLTQQSGADFVEIASSIGRKYSVPEGGKIELTKDQSSTNGTIDFSPTGR